MAVCRLKVCWAPGVATGKGTTIDGAQLSCELHHKYFEELGLDKFPCLRAAQRDGKVQKVRRGRYRTGNTTSEKAGSGGISDAPQGDTAASTYQAGSQAGPDATDTRGPMMGVYNPSGSGGVHTDRMISGSKQGGRPVAAKKAASGSKAMPPMPAAKKAAAKKAAPTPKKAGGKGTAGTTGSRSY